MNEIRTYNEIYDYLSAPNLPAAPAPALVFGRHDERLAQTMGQLHHQGLTTEFVISGWFGKDSGELWDTRQSESAFVAAKATEQYGVDPGHIHLEQRALVGSENARFGLRLMSKLGVEMTEVTAIAHGTSLRRLAASAVHEAAKLDIGVHAILKAPTHGAFDPANPAHQQEATAELLRVVEWAKSGHIAPQAEQPDENLVAFARDQTTTPTPPAPYKLTVLRHLPHNIRRKIMLG